MNFSTIDLNLLRVLDAVLQERNITRAAARVHLSQPALSNALNRLRAALGDPILVRGRGGMLATPRALAMAEPVRLALAQLEQALQSPLTFNPEQATGVVRLTMPDYAEFVLLPRLTEHIRQHAPGIHIAVYSLGEGGARNALLEGQVDIALGYLPELPTTLYRQALFEESFVTMVQRHHPQVPGCLTLDTFCALEHLLVSPQGGGFSGVVDQYLATQQRSRTVVLSVPHFLVVPAIIERTLLAATLARTVAEHLARYYAVELWPTPLAVPAFTVSQAWHARTQHDPLQRWVRGCILALTRNDTLQQSLLP